MGASFGFLGKIGGGSKRAHHDEIIRSRKIDDMQEKKQMIALSTVKLLLLGAGESGKSTLFKQMISIYGKGWPQSDRLRYVEAIHTNCIQSMRTLCIWVDRLEENRDWPKEIEDLRIFILQYNSETTLVNKELMQAWNTIWKFDASLKRTLAQRTKFQLLDSAEYYFGRLEDIADPDYIPSEDDVMRTRIKTTGIIETEFIINETKFAMFDVGGQRSERKKWMHCFEDVTAVLFVAAMSEFDQVLEEDDDTNRIDEALDLFNQTCNDKWLRNTAMILFLNKSDLLEKKLESSRFSDYDPGYEGANTMEEVAARIELMFKQQNLNKKRPVYAHITCATNPENVKHVFNSVKDIILTRSLQSGGLDV